jgi:hypothetical protein
MPPPIKLATDPLQALETVEALEPGSFLARTAGPRGTVDLVPGLVLAWSVPLDLSSLTLEIAGNGIVLWSTVLSPSHATERWTGNQHLFKGDLEIRADFVLGEITASGFVGYLPPDDAQFLQFPETVLVAWSPTLGAVGGQLEAHPPQIKSASFGNSNSIVPTITRIPVDTVKRIGTPVGNMVKQALFPTTGDFTFNVCFSVGPFIPFLPGAYGDPTSIWFNVFAGYYEIDCPKSGWTRPFGYNLASTGGTGATPNFDDLVLIGKADWNYFSNWMYGVPLATVQQYDPPDPGVVCQYLGRQTVANSQWDVVDINGFSAVSAYQSKASGAAQLVDNTTLLTPLWRVTYGEPRSRSGHDTSFPGTSMHAQFLMAFSEDATTYRTYLFGGTVNKAFDADQNATFMTEQMTACRQVITDHYATLGFPLTIPAG